MDVDLFGQSADTATFGPSYDPAVDGARVGKQMGDIFAYLTIHARHGHWRTLAEMRADTGYPEASISAQLRHLRKARFGAHVIEKRRRHGQGTWEYKLGR